MTGHRRDGRVTFANGIGFGHGRNQAGSETTTFFAETPFRCAAKPVSMASRSSPSTAGVFSQGVTLGPMEGSLAMAQSTGLIATARLRTTISPSPGGV